MWGATGITRLFNDEMGTQVSWLIPAALVALVGLFWVTRRARRTDGVRAAALLWGSWLVVTGLVFSFAAGIIHPYYNVVLAPAIGALVGIGGVRLWQDRGRFFGRLLLAAGVAISGVWAFVLLDRTPGWQPWLRYFGPRGGLRRRSGDPGAAIHRLAASTRSRSSHRGAGRTARGAARVLGTDSVEPPVRCDSERRARRRVRRLRWRLPRLPPASRGVSPAEAASDAPRATAVRRAPQADGFHRAGGSGTRTGCRAAQAPVLRRTGGLGGLLDAATPSKQIVTLLKKERAATAGRRRRSARTARPGSRSRAASRSGNRRLQRERPDANARAVQGIRHGGKDPLLPRERRWNGPRWLRLWSGQRDDPGLGSRHIHVHHSRRGHRVRPHEPELVRDPGGPKCPRYDRAPPIRRSGRTPWRRRLM